MPLDSRLSPSLTSSALDAPARYLQHVLGLYFTSGNRIRILRNGDEIFPAMLDAIERAEHRIEFLTFVYWTGDIAQRFADALSAKARSGLTVRVLLDAYGAAKMRHELVDEMKEAGVRVCWFRSIKRVRPWRYDKRTHRKILVCDRQVAFTGGVGIAAEWEGNARHPGEWRDTHFEVRGPAVDGLAGAFWDNWLEMCPDDPSPPDAELAELTPCGDDTVMVVRSSSGDQGCEASITLRSGIRLAQRELLIGTPYLVLDPETRELLCAAARRGVRTVLLIPGPHIDKRFEHFTAEDDFRVLLEAGVEVYRYQPSMLHLKVMLVDDTLAIVGSANLNQRSMRRDAEALLVLTGQERNAELRRHFAEDLQRAKRESETHWAHRPWWHRLISALIAPFRSEL